MSHYVQSNDTRPTEDDNEPIANHLIGKWEYSVSLKAAAISYKVPPRWRKGPNWPPKKKIEVIKDMAVIPSPNNDAAESLKHDDISPNYTRRLVLCNRGCTRRTDTTTKQMWEVSGNMRAIVCVECKYQSRTKLWTCECDTPWHKCLMHRADPAVHNTRRANKKLGDGVFAAAAIELLPTSRMLPSDKRTIDASHINGTQNKFLKPTDTGNGLVGAFGLSLSACPRLAAKFAFSHPHLFKDQDVESDTAPNMDAVSLSLDTHTGVSMVTEECYPTSNPPVVLPVQQTVRKFKFPVQSSPSGTVPPLNRSGSVRTVDT